MDRFGRLGRRDVLGLLAGTAAGHAWAGEPAPADLTEPRFRVAVARGVRNSTLRATVASVAERGRVALSLAEILAEERYSLAGPARPLRDVLAALAWAPGATWLAPGGSPLRLARTRADGTRLEAERARKAREGRLALERRWAQVEQWVHLDEAGLRQLARTEPGMAGVLAHRRARAAMRLAFSLPAPFRPMLGAQDVRQGALADLPPEGQRLVAEVMLGSGRRDFDLQSFLREGRFQMQVAGPPDRLTVWLDIGTPGPKVSTNLLYAEGWTRQPPAERRAVALAKPTPARTALLRRKVTLRDPQGPRSATIAERPEGALPLLPLVEELAAAAGAAFVVQTDFHPRPEDEAARKVDPRAVRRWLGAQWWLGEPIVDQPLALALDLLCADFEYEWTTRGEVIALRHRRWYLPEEERSRGKPRTPLFPRAPRPRPPG